MDSGVYPADAILKWWASGDHPIRTHIPFHQFQQLSFAHDGVAQVEPGKFNLLGMIKSERIQKPVVQWPVIFEFERAYGVGIRSRESEMQWVKSYMGYMHHVSAVRWWVALRMRYITGSLMLIFGDPMSIFARSVLEPSGNSLPACAQTNRDSPQPNGCGTDCRYPVH